MRQAVPTSAAPGLPCAVAGALGFAAAGWDAVHLPAGSFGFIYLPALAGIVVASVLCAPLGARFAHTLPAATLKRIFALFLLVLGVHMLFF